MAYTDGYTPLTALKLKKLLAILAELVPFQNNIDELARKLNISRDSIYNYRKYLKSPDDKYSSCERERDFFIAKA